MGWRRGFREPQDRESESHPTAIENRVAGWPIALPSLALALGGSNPMTSPARRERKPELPLLPASVIVDEPALAGGPLSCRPMLVSGRPIFRQVRPLTFQRAPLPVAFQAGICAHLWHPIRGDNSLPGGTGASVPRLKLLTGL